MSIPTKESNNDSILSSTLLIYQTRRSLGRTENVGGQVLFQVDASSPSLDKNDLFPNAKFVEAIYYENPNFDEVDEDDDVASESSFNSFSKLSEISNSSKTRPLSVGKLSKMIQKLSGKKL